MFLLAMTGMIRIPATRAADFGPGVWTMIAASITPTTLSVYANGAPLVAPETIDGWPIDRRLPVFRRARGSTG